MGSNQYINETSQDPNFNDCLRMIPFPVALPFFFKNGCGNISGNPKKP